MDIVKDMFEASMKREKKEITMFTSGEKFNAFFRMMNDNTNRRDGMKMFYPVDSPCKMGSLISFNGNTYLVLNQETAENDVYMKSAVMRCNGKVTTHSLTVVDLPFYCQTVVNDNLQEKKFFNLMDGTADFMTEENTASHSICIGDKVNEWGRTWEITNIYFIDGICHAVMEMREDEAPVYDYSVELSDLDITYNVGATAKLSATAYLNGKAVQDATFTFESSDEGIATIDANGNIAFISDGNPVLEEISVEMLDELGITLLEEKSVRGIVRFTATWNQTGVSQTTNDIYVLMDDDDTISIYVTPIDQIADCEPETLTYYAMRGTTRDDSIPVSFKMENLTVQRNYEYWAKHITITDNGDHTVTVLADDLIDKRFDLVAYNDELGIENRQNIKIVSLFF